MSEVIKIRRGLDIKIQGTAEKIILTAEKSKTYAVKPPDFPGLAPRLNLKPGAKVKAGDCLFYSKERPEIKFTSPVCGEVTLIDRGERRRILEVIVTAGKENDYIDFGAADPGGLDPAMIKEKIQLAGLWPAIRQRPYAVIANPDKKPKGIFISCFDSSPLAPDLDFTLKGQLKAFQAGIDALGKLTYGKIHLGLNALYPPADTFVNVAGIVLHYFKGPHPSGNPGIHIHHIDPVNKGETVWYIHPEHVIQIGNLFLKGIYDATRLVALTGSGVRKPVYYRMLSGASIEPLVSGNVSNAELRYISGNVLTGTQITKIGHLGYYSNQVTVIPEGKHFELLGWAMPGFKKYSASRSFWSWLAPHREYQLDTNLNGGERAFVMTGEYEKVLPMNIYPVYLLKAILAEDIDRMENLGIYEVAEEDFALCEFVCTSKINVQSIIRKGLEMMIREVE
jgi:Na+-transporting NADH:ubiquinone oxidoreductase subunit A